MRFFIRPGDYRMLLSSVGPLFAFIAPWAAVLVGQQAALCGIIDERISSFYFIIIGNMLSFFLLAFIIQTFFPQKLSSRSFDPAQIPISPHFKRVTALLLIGYFGVQAMQVALFKGFPLLWLVLKIPKTYFDYGIHSINGLLNAVYLLATTAVSIIWLREGNKRTLLLLLGLSAVPILLVSRQLLITVFLQIACCAIIFNPRNFTRFLKFAGVILALFLWIGNFRTGMNRLIEILQPKPFVPKLFYPLLWVYAYIVTPFNNINAQIDQIEPLGKPYHEVFSLLPSVIRTKVGLEGGETGFKLVHDNMTVSSFYFEPLLDFGRVYAFLFMAIFQIFVLLAFRRALRQQTPLSVLHYSVFYAILVLSVFSNMLIYLPVVFQLALLSLARLKLVRRFGVLAVAKES